MDEQVSTPRTVPVAEAEELQRAFIVKVYGWMTVGLALSAIAAVMTLGSESILQLLFASRWTILGLIAVQIGLVVWLSTRIQAMSAMTATLVYCGYSALTGVTLSVVLLLYTASSVASTFAVTAGMFGATALYGSVTKRDLTGLGGFMAMGVFGLVAASVVNWFLANETVYWLITYVGIIIFVGLAAYDAQKIKAMSGVAIEGGETEQKAAIIGALRLYLDFVNLFLLLLRLLGRRR